MMIRELQLGTVWQAEPDLPLVDDDLTALFSLILLKVSLWTIETYVSIGYIQGLGANLSNATIVINDGPFTHCTALDW